MSYQSWAMPPPMPVDPTNVSGKRIAAWLIDGVIFVIVFMALTAGLGLGPNSEQVPTDELRRSAAVQQGSEPTSDDAETFCNDWNADHGGWGNGICLPNQSGMEAETGSATIIKDFSAMAWMFLALVVIFIIYQGLLGASLGKLSLGLRIVKSDGSRAGIGASAIRTVLWVVDAITCGLPVLGGILIVATKGHRRIGDMAAGTYVVSANQVGYPVILGGSIPPGAYQPTPYGSVGPHGPGGPYGAVGPHGPAGPPGPTGPQGFQNPPFPEHHDAPGGGDYEADVPVWDEARGSYIQYDSERAAWLEFDTTRQTWGPISS